MRLPIRSLLGFSAAALSMACVVIAGVTAPRAETVLHASAKCPETATESPLVTPPAEAKRPA